MLNQLIMLLNDIDIIVPKIGTTFYQTLKGGGYGEDFHNRDAFKLWYWIIKFGWGLFLPFSLILFRNIIDEFKYIIWSMISSLIIFLWSSYKLSFSCDATITFFLWGTFMALGFFYKYIFNKTTFTYKIKLITFFLLVSAIYFMYIKILLTIHEFDGWKNYNFLILPFISLILYFNAYLFNKSIEFRTKWTLLGVFLFIWGSVFYTTLFYFDLDSFCLLELSNNSGWGSPEKYSYLLTYQVTFENLLTVLPEISLAIICLINLITVAIANAKPITQNYLKQQKLSIFLTDVTEKSLKLDIVVYLYSALILNKDFAYIIVFKIIILLTSIFVLNNSKTYLLQHKKNYLEYSFLIISSIFFLIILLSVTEFFFMLICIIGFSLNMYILILKDAPNPKAIEASVKYFYLSALSSGLIASGALIIFFVMQTTDFFVIQDKLNKMTCDNTKFALLTLALYSILFGFFFKLAAFPCHLWIAEIYEGSPNPVMIFFILPIKIATFIFFIKLLNTVFLYGYCYWSHLLWFSSIMSMIWGCLAALNEPRIKKFIAYSSINQMGYLLLCLVCGKPIPFDMALIYLIIYIIMNIGFLQFYSNTFNKINKKSINYLIQLKNYISGGKIYSIGLIIILFSMAGIPPLAGFFGKYMLFLEAFKAEYFSLILVGMITSLISTFYYLRIVKILFWEHNEIELKKTYTQVYKNKLLTTKFSYNKIIIYIGILLFLSIMIFLLQIIFKSVQTWLSI